LYPVDSSRAEEGTVRESSRQSQLTVRETGHGHEFNAGESQENGKKSGPGGGPSNEQTKRGANDKPKFIKDKKND